LRILFTQHSLVHRGGSELFVLEAASVLKSLGHETAVYCGQFGQLAEPLAEKGVHLLSDPRSSPWEPDIVHGQHRLFALKALAAFPKTPAILHIHGFLPELEKPFVHPRIMRYLVISGGSVAFWSRHLGVAENRFEVFLNFFSPAKFKLSREAAETPRTALLYSSQPFGETETDCIRRACSRRGIVLATAGRHFGREVDNPEELLPKFDVVFTAGRSALEAAASGCGVVPVAGGMAEELLQPANYLRLRGQNMSPAFYRHYVLCEEWIAQQLDAWNAHDVSAASALVREECGSPSAFDRLLGVYREVLEAAAGKPLSPLEEEFEATACLIDGAMGDSIDSLRVQLTDTQQQLQAIRHSTCWRSTAAFRRMADCLRRRRS